MKVKLPNEHIEFFADLPEHGMGYQNVIIELHDGRELNTIVENPSDLVIPDGIRYEDIKSIVYK